MRLWNLADPAAEPAVLQGHYDGVYALAFSPDGRWLASGGCVGEARLWRVRSDDLVDLACQLAGRNLTRAEWEEALGGEPYRATCPGWPTPGE